MDDAKQPDRRRRQLLRGLAGLGAACAGLSGTAHADVRNIRMSVDGRTTRVVFDLEAARPHSVFTLDDPSRVVVDLEGARIPQGLTLQPPAGAVVEGFRYAPRNGTDLRIVLDLRGPIGTPHSFTLLPAQGAPHRLVIDLVREAAPAAAAGTTARAIPSDRTVGDRPLREVIVAIDAGHGGRDPGAIGAGGTREKDVVLEIAKRLQARVDAEFGMRSFMVRTGDYFLPLRQRIDRARAANADVFLSIHADAIHDRSIQGSSVYMLSERGASSEAARFLAESENRSDLRLGGVPIEQHQGGLASVLLDLAQSGSLEASHHLAQKLIAEMHRVGKVRKPQVERAAFAVLRSPDVPSVLIEAAFISNPTEERRLRTPSFQEALAGAVLTGLRMYFDVHAPPDTLIAEGRGDRHVIRPGETLSLIADQYRLSIAELRAVNDLSGDRIYAGQVLRIPRRGG